MKIKNPGMIFLVPSQFLGNSYPTQEGTRHDILPSLTFKKNFESHLLLKSHRTCWGLNSKTHKK